MGIALEEIKRTPIKKIDYVGFTFNGVHSSQLKILSVSDGSRYHWDLLPNIEDYSVDVVGAYGSNYFGGNFKTRTITLDVAFDEVEEIHLRAIRELFSEREIHDLYFDENPYIVYNACISKTPNIKFVAFGNTGTRIYKGEGTITFTCYDPVGYSKRGNYLNQYYEENIEEWAAASGMKNSKNKYINGSWIYDYYDNTQGNLIHTFNAGNIPTSVNLYINWVDNDLIITNTNFTTGQEKMLHLKKASGNNSSLILIDTSRSVAMQVAVDNSESSGYTEFPNGATNQIVLNHLLVDGRFFMMPPGENELVINGNNRILKLQYYHRYI